ncbi:MAG TPA: cytochrome-c peroxidase, partial [Gemmatimonadaceae bacterium]|nr:cytochrome-c peroxidase [Gemmatimonadaceae bacterium]
MYYATLRRLLALSLGCGALGACSDLDPERATAPVPNVSASITGDDVDARLRGYLVRHGFTGRMASTLETRLGRRIDHQLANVGRLLWFDPIQGLNDDNTCGGCHSPTHGFGDTQPIAIGIENNRIVGPGRTGPRNQRRSPMVINAVFYPTLMWNSRFHARSGDPFDNSAGFVFPAPEGLTLSYLPHLLTAQAFIPPTERVEAAGFHFPGTNDDIRAEVLRRLTTNDNYRQLFARAFPEVKSGGAITFDHFGRAIAEFEFTLVFADAPIDRYARGIGSALTERQKHGAVLFFGRAGCVQCHAVSGQSNEMFSDFREHVAGIPQIAPALGNVPFDGPGADEDFGLEQVTG